MRLKEGFGERTFVEYTYDTGDGQVCASAMPATVALEIARRRDPKRLEGGRLVVADLYSFDATPFEVEEGDLDEPKAAPRRRGKSRA